MLLRHLLVACLIGGLGCVPSGPAAGRVEGARFVRAHDWSGRGEWIGADLHAHTRFSDGAHSVAEVAEKARQFGCRALAITDHADRRGRAATPEYEADVRAARTAHPDLAIVAGLEWNVPPWGGEEHASVLVPPGPRELATLAEFKRRFDDFQLEDRPKPDARAALEWLAGATSGSPPVVVYNHPSRADAASMENVIDIRRWRDVNDLVVGFEGAPGHQRYTPTGGYKYKEKTIERWDPVAARPGDAWDTLLQGGVDVHGALAASDFHNASPRDLHDYWPCEFAETWLYVPERSPAGVLEALRAGSFFAAHGHIARAVELTVTAAGLSRPAAPGEAIEAAPGAVLTVSLSLTVPERDWQAQPNRLDAVEFLVVTPGDVSVRSHALGGPGRRSASDTIVLGPAGVVIRARGRRIIADGPDLMFYTNAVRVTASGAR